jgi:hypothetical protein
MATHGYPMTFHPTRPKSSWTTREMLIWHSKECKKMSDDLDGPGNLRKKLDFLDRQDVDKKAKEQGAPEK